MPNGTPEETQALGQDIVDKSRSWYTSLSRLRSRKLLGFLIVFTVAIKTLAGAETPEQEEMGLSMILWGGIVYILAQGLEDACEAIARGMAQRTQ